MKRLICCEALALAAGSAVAQAKPDLNTAKIFNGSSPTDLTAAGLLCKPQAKAAYRKGLDGQGAVACQSRWSEQRVPARQGGG